VAAAPLARVLGFEPPERINWHDHAITATLAGGHSPLAIVITRWGERLDPLWRLAIIEGRRRNAAWCVLFNGVEVRLIDTTRVHTRRYAAFDLDLMLDDDATLGAFLKIVAPETLTASAPGEHHTKLHAIVAQSELHAAGVCRSLRSGVLIAATEFTNALLAGPAPFVGRRPRRIVALGVTFEQALTVVYRILFFLFAEARGLLPVWHPVYRDSYSVEVLGAAAANDGTVPGLWEGLQAIGRLAHAGCHAGDLTVTAFNGRLFAHSGAPLAERPGLDDAAAKRALVALTTRPAPDAAGQERIAYGDLGVEQLGAVYETLLDYEPRRSTDTAAGTTRVSLVSGSGLRKATGTFYTPQSIASYLVRTTLGPLVRDASPEQILALRIVDPAMGSGAFLVAACRYLSQAYEAALVATGQCHPTDLGPEEQATSRRLVAERCLYGVDLNPMAVQLARLSLWLATLSAHRPLSFLDHRLMTGDSLVGAWLSNLRTAPAARGAVARRPLPLLEVGGLVELLRHSLPSRFSMADTPSDSLNQVKEKERALAALLRPDGALSRWKRVADLWCANWYSAAPPPGSAFGALSDAILTDRGALPESTARGFLQQAGAIAIARRFFHWELEFPETFFDAQGAPLAAPGFDAVIGNPPWDMIRGDSGTDEARERARLDGRALVRFSRESGAYFSQSDGHANRYQLFVERSIALTRAGGRLGLVLPWGLAADHGSAALRRLLFSRTHVEAVVGFDNRRGVFPIHRSTRFMLLTAQTGGPTTTTQCRLGEHDPIVLEALSDEPGRAEFPVQVTPALLEHLTGPELAIPDLRAPLDVTIAERAAALHPRLSASEGWNVMFGRELNVSEDRRFFLAAGHGLPVIEGKQIEPFTVGIERTRWSMSRRQAADLLGDRHRHPRLAYRDVASATNRRTLIAAILPGNVVSTHTVFALRTRMPLEAQYFLCGMLNSLVVNYLARLRVTSHVTTAIVGRLPIPRDLAPREFDQIAGAARRLARGRDGKTSALLDARVARFPLEPAADRARALSAFGEL
jgi:hypothetical protein